MAEARLAVVGAGAGCRDRVQNLHMLKRGCEDIMGDTLRIMLAVNNPDNGVHSGYLRAVDFADLLSVWAYDNAMTCRRESIGVDRIRIGRKTFPILGYRTWVGNWCWDAILVDGDVANAIAEHVRKSGKFHPEMGVSEVWDAWNSGAPIDLRVTATP